MQDKILQAVQEKGAKKIGLQVPEGLKNKAVEWAQEIEKTGAKVYIFADPCYGACDLWDFEADRLGCDLLIHVGHSTIGIEEKIPTVYIEYESDLDISKIVEKAGQEIEEKKIGLTTTLQHIKQLDKIKEILEKSGKEVVIGKAGTRSKYDGQILGCDPGVIADADAYLYIGTGNFHAIEIALATGKKVYIADPELDQIRILDDEKEEFLRKRFAKIENVKGAPGRRGAGAQKFGILVSIKPGQNRMDLAEKLKKMCEEKGKQAEILVMDYISPEKLLGFGFDAYVNTACPRIAIDDSGNYDKPLLTPQELEIVLGIREWEKYKLDRF
jgi:2-(3-amino-3-carboxypropyl)histidine synthase